MSADAAGRKTSPGFGASIAVPKELLPRIDRLKVIPDEPRWRVIDRVVGAAEVRAESGTEEAAAQ